jgi:hypothetical protein
MNKKEGLLMGALFLRVLIFITRSRRKVVFSRNQVLVPRKICVVPRLLSFGPRQIPRISRYDLEISIQKEKTAS